MLMVNVIAASHLEAIKKFLENNEDYVFKMRRYRGEWYASITNIDDDPWDHITASDPSFEKTVATVSRQLSTKPESK